METAGQAVSVFLKDFQYLLGDAVQGKVLFPGGIICAIILKSKGIRQDIGSDDLPVSVQYIATSTF